MKVDRLHREQRLRISLSEAWTFFSTPKNLNELTPPELRFQIVSGADAAMHEGQILCYRIRILPGVWWRWVTEIKSVERERQFVDEQRFGPYRFWHHRHAFEAVDGGVRMTDTVHYALPFGVFGRLAAVAIVRRQLDQIFDFRRRALDERFGALG